MRTVSIVNQKGGCGKTTTAISLAGLYASQGHRVLLVDMDPQSHCAAGLGIPEKRIELDITDALSAADGLGVDPAKLIWKPSRNLDLIPSRMKLAGLEAARGGFADREDRQRRLAAVLSALSPNYDICLIDCSPAIGLLTYSALSAASIALIPVDTSYFSLLGASKQVHTVRSLGRQLGFALRPCMVATIHDIHSGLASELFDDLRKRFGDTVCPYPVRQDPHLKEAASIGKSIIQYAPDSPSAQDYGMVAAWLKPRLFSGSGDSLPGDDQESTPDSAGVVQVVGSVQTAALAQRLAAKPSPSSDFDPQSALRKESHADQSGTAVATEEPPKTVGIPGQIVADLRTRTQSRADEVARLAQRIAGRAQPSPAAAAIATEAAPAEATTLTLIQEPKPETTRPASGMPMGATQTGQGVLFVQPAAMGQEIAIAADFNGWSTQRHVMKRNLELGVFELCVPLPPGRYSYRLVVDGCWQRDPFNTLAELNPFGEQNSVLVVPGA